MKVNGAHKEGYTKKNTNIKRGLEDNQELESNKRRQKASVFKILANGDEELSLKLKDHKLVNLLPKTQTTFAYWFLFSERNFIKLIIIIISKEKLINVLVVTDSQLKLVKRLLEFHLKYRLERAGYITGFERKMALKYKVDVLPHRTIEEYSYIGNIGKGRYGQVFKALDLKTGESVAIKKVEYRLSDDTYSAACVREMHILRRLDHKNIIKLKAIVSDQPDMDNLVGDQYKFLILEFMDLDLYKVIYVIRKPLIEDYIIGTMRQILEGLNYCHERNFMHRDIKPSNILLNRRGEVKLADFGLAQEKKEKTLTPEVVTLHYRAPELLLGDENYGLGIDIWSCGCILGELFKLAPLFHNAQTEIEHLESIYMLCGTATPDVWPNVVNLPLFKMITLKKFYERCLQEKCWYMSQNARNLLDRMLQLDPAKRITTGQALESVWFKN